MTREEIEQLELSAQYADDPRCYRNEMAEVARLRARYGHARTFPQTPQPAPAKQSTGRRVANSVAEALAMMEQHLGVTA